MCKEPWLDSKHIFKKILFKQLTIARSGGGREDLIRVYMTSCCKWKSATKDSKKTLENVKFFRNFEHDFVAIFDLQHGVIYTWCEPSRPPLEHAIVECLKRVFSKKYFLSLAMALWKNPWPCTVQSLIEWNRLIQWGFQNRTNVHFNDLRL